ncbi:hypothetical protein M2R28_21955 [Aeromonas hydrophila]|uniref:hypothetical protein n=1 Tax=Aeromonas hydrophila TaxID=644 RepID=UPI001F4C2220|nr:hypothetical protein [Aeromonas hydrophila]MCO4202311.1 hypothetical protein [Aeromonas hydrophila]UNB58394.1 hypothetical protein MKW86_22030 [Aeromonas hydrophila]
MRATVKYNNFFAYSRKSKKYFITEFSNSINIVHGKNTSGKSTFLQCILYTFGINDEKGKLGEILSENVIFRLDFTVKKASTDKVSIVRDDEIVSIKLNDSIPIKFIGIGGNKSREHIKLKEFLSELFGFNLYLEYEGEYKLASLEAMFLPYYIAQDVGWVYRHKSFRGLDFVRNFKTDFFDYFLGIVNNFDRIEKTKLDSQKREIEAESKIFHHIAQRDRALKVAKLQDERFLARSNEYIKPYKDNKSELIELEKNYIITCNKLTILEESRKVLLKVRRSLDKDLIASDTCPTCSKNIEHTTEETYSYLQDVNDTNKQLSDLNDNIKSLKSTQGDINTLIEKINKKKIVVESDYQDLLDYKVDNLTFESWLKTKVNVELSEEITKKLGENHSKLIDIEEKLKGFKTDEVVLKERKAANYRFKEIFERHVSDLNVKPFGDDRFYLLYAIPAFPRQGVELLKTLLAYNFSFLEIIKTTDYTHVLPFVMDAIFEGDLEDESRKEILAFISKNIVSEQQVIFSIADSKTNVVSAQKYNEQHFGGKAKLICIGGNTNTRSLLNKDDLECNGYLRDTIAILA